MKSTSKVLLVALAAGIAGAVAGVFFNGAGLSPLLHTETGQRALQGIAAATAPPVPADVKIAKRGQPVPALQLAALQGGTVELPSAYRGRRVLVNVWASWCGPCIEEMPELDRFARSQPVQGVQVVGVALDDADAVRRFLQEVPVSYLLLLDSPGPADAGVRLGNPKGLLPYTVLIDAQGRLVKQKLGPFRPGEIDGWAAGE